MIQYKLIKAVFLLRHLTVTEDVALVFCIVIADKFLFALTQHLPVTVLNDSRIAGTRLLLCHLLVELLLVNGITVLAADQLGKIERESVGVEEAESLLAVEFLPAVRLQFVHCAVQQCDALVQRAEERILFFLHHTPDQFTLCGEFRVSRPHLTYQYIQELVHEGFFLSEERVGVTHGTAQDAADNVTGLGIAGQLSVSDREGNGTQVVGNDTHGDVYLLLLVHALAVRTFREGVVVLPAGEPLNLGNDRCEDIRIIVGVLSLHQAHQTLEAHTGINHVHLQRFETAVSLAVELHEDNVPDFDDLRMILVDEFFTGHFRFLFLRTEVDMNLRARPAGSRIAHLPEVVMLVAIDDMVLREVLLPVAGRLIVTTDALCLVAFENRYVKVFRVEMEHVDEIFISVIDCALLEVIAEAPVTQHLEHGVVAQRRITSHLLQVVMLAAHTQALLRIGAAARLRLLCSEDNIFPLVHTSIGKHQRRVVLDNHWGRRYDNMSFRLKELQVRVADFVCCHHLYFVFNSIFLSKIVAKILTFAYFCKQLGC